MSKVSEAIASSCARIKGVTRMTKTPDFRADDLFDNVHAADALLVRLRPMVDMEGEEASESSAETSGDESDLEDGEDEILEA